MNNAKQLLILMPLALSGCVSLQSAPFEIAKQSFSQPKVVHENIYFNPSNQARIRFYNPIQAFPSTSCDTWKNGKTQRYLNNILSPKLPNKDITLIGIPETASSQQILNHSGRINLDGFKEMVVNANEKIIFEGATLEDDPVLRRTCSVAIGFIPEAGKDYEIKYIEKYKTCSIQITEIAVQQTQVLTKNADNKNMTYCN
ncbi:hypothetical protein KTH71_09385 [Acinetobacter sp. WU_MDCI_Axc73]|nr:hypothetical protein [Acinetobacter sp. WU_MDCI_Axc73]